MIDVDKARLDFIIWIRNFEPKINLEVATYSESEEAGQSIRDFYQDNGVFSSVQEVIRKANQRPIPWSCGEFVYE